MCSVGVKFNCIVNVECNCTVCTVVYTRVPTRAIEDCAILLLSLCAVRIIASGRLALARGRLGSLETSLGWSSIGIEKRALE